MRPLGPGSGRESVAKRRARVRQWLKFDASEYERTSNPVHAWDAITACLAAGLPLPEWTRVYLFDAGSHITKLSRARVPKKNAIDREVARALGLRATGAHNPFRDAWRNSHDRLIAEDVWMCHAEHRVPTWSLAAVFETVAETHHETCDECKRKISAAKVKQCWYKNAASFPPIVERASSKKVGDLSR